MKMYPTEFPVVNAISLSLAKTKGTVSGFGLNRVFWLFLEFCTTSISESPEQHIVKRTYHRDEPKISLPLQVSFDDSQTASCRLCNGLDEQTLAYSQFDTNVVWAEPVDAEINGLKKRLIVLLRATLDNKE